MSGWIGVDLDGTLDWLVTRNIIEPTYAESVRWKSARAEIGKRRESKLPPMAPKGSVESMRRTARLIDIPSPRRERDIAIIEFMASSGCRIGEVCALHLKDIDLKDRRAKVTGKGNKERIAFISPAAADALKRYWLVRGFDSPSDPAFARHDDGAGAGHLAITTTGMRQIIRQIALVAGLDGFHPHLFRHGFGVTMLRKTGNLALVQDLLGHASPASTRVYAKIDPADLQEAHAEVWGR